MEEDTRDNCVNNRFKARVNIAFTDIINVETTDLIR